MKKKFFSTTSERDNNVLEAKITIWGCRYGLWDFIFLFIFELGTCLQNLIFTKVVEGCRKIISTKGYAEIHIQRPFFENKISIWKILGFKVQMVETCSSTSSTCRNFYFWKTPKSRFLVVFQSFIFGQILEVLDRFSCIHSGWEHAWTWAEIFKTP